MKKIVVLALLLANSISITCRAAELQATPPEDISLTIYNQNFGLVREERTFDLTSGINNLRVEDVAATIDPTSVSFQSLTAPNSVVVREQNYQYDLIDPVTVLSKSLGKTVKFKQFLPGRTNELTGILLNSPQAVVTTPDGTQAVTYQGLVVKTPEAIVLNPQGQVELTELPGGLVGKPSLLWKLECAKPGTHKSEISYQAASMNWNCDYVAVLDKADEKADLTSWVTLDNKSGATYKNASLKLMAGDVHKIQPQAAPMPMMAEAADMAVSAMPPPQFSEQSFAEYHLYTLQGKTTVANNETKQLSLFNASDIPVKKLFVFEPTAGEYQPYSGTINAQKVNVKIEVDNSEANHLGMPLPKGKVRVYKKDNDGALQFIGEDQIDHTPKDEKIRLYIGDAFDLTAERKQTNQQQVSSTVQRSSYQIDLRNHKKEDVTITCIEHSWGTWKILNSSQPYTKKDAKTFEFTVKVPANGAAQVTYEIETR